MTMGRLMVDISGRTIALIYPEECESDEFGESWTAACATLHGVTFDFALIHDLSAVQSAAALRSRIRTVLTDATSIARHGHVKVVAVVFTGSYLVERLGTALLTLSPVKPARIFRESATAHAWCHERTLAFGRPPTTSALQQADAKQPIDDESLSASSSSTAEPDDAELLLRTPSSPVSVVTSGFSKEAIRLKPAQVEVMVMDCWL